MNDAIAIGPRVNVMLEVECHFYDSVFATEITEDAEKKAS